MVRFTLRDNRKSASMRLELRAEDSVGEISSIASEYWGEDGFLMRNGYRLVGSEGSVGDFVHEGDLVELIPDPSTLRF